MERVRSLVEQIRGLGQRDLDAVADRLDVIDDGEDHGVGVQLADLGDVLHQWLARDQAVQEGPEGASLGGAARRDDSFVAGAASDEK